MTYDKFNKMHFGTEPFFAEINLHMLSKKEINALLLKSFNYYNYMCSDVIKRKYINVYLKNNNYNKSDINAVKKLQDYYILPSSAWLCRMITDQGLVPTEKIQNQLDGMIDYMVKTAINNQPKTVVTKQTASVHDRHMNNVKMHVANIENEIDIFIKNDCKSKFSFSEYMSLHNIKPRTKTMILSHFTNILDEYKSVINNSDPELTEAYSFLSRPQQKRVEKFLVSFFPLKKVVKKKKKKPRSITKKSAIKRKIKRKIKKMESTNSDKISNTLIEAWFWDKDERMLTKFVALPETILDFTNGKSVVNADDEISLRKCVKVSQVESVLEYMKSAADEDLNLIFEKIVSKPRWNSYKMYHGMKLIRGIA